MTIHHAFRKKEQGNPFKDYGREHLTRLPKRPSNRDSESSGRNSFLVEPDKRGQKFDLAGRYGVLVGGEVEGTDLEGCHEADCEESPGAEIARRQD